MIWENKYFGECAQLIQNTIQPSDAHGLPYIGLEHVSQGNLSLLGYGKSDDVISIKLRFQEGDILFGKLRPYFRKIIIAPFDGVCSTDIWVVRAKPGIDQRFLFYWMASNEFIEIANRGSEGTKMPRAQWDVVRRIQKRIPNENEQRAIAAILGALDDKIELNRRMNRTFEEMAQAIYIEMIRYVDTQCSILEFADLLSGGTPSTAVDEYWNGDIEWISAKDVSNTRGLFILDTEKKISRTGLENSAAKILPEKTSIVTARGTVGAHCMISKPMAMNQTNYGLKGKNGIGDYFIFLTLSNMIEELRQQSYGTIFDTITTKTFQSVFCPQPSLEIIHEFENQVTPLMDAILNNEMQSQTLTNLRDALLPKLMRGEVKVEDVLF